MDPTFLACRQATSSAAVPSGSLRRSPQDMSRNLLSHPRLMTFLIDSEHEVEGAEQQNCANDYCCNIDRRQMKFEFLHRRGIFGSTNLQADTIRRETRFVRSLQLSTKVKVPLPHMLAVIVKDQANQLQMLTQTRAWTTGTGVTSRRYLLPTARRS
ncbi:hypothetical protein HF086_016012 [Spodoptera exigua]|uniref:Uncharacterized protein n=1 Tax=Spodoptera exigua TaxID=7107 RepID=A0A922SJT0_SPOEX|nr:hypothetical protein HF086_016012 [Spodoptera exigua]